MTTMTRVIALTMLFSLGWTDEVRPAVVVPDEIHALRRWVVAKVEGGGQAALPTWGLAVLANYDELCRNTRMGQPLRLGQTEYHRGVFCHAGSKVAVRLPGPGKTISATVGVDSNVQTRGGRGSVVFSVAVGGKEAFRSQVMHEGTAAERISLDLGGATEFLLEVGDAGDGIACDQADWADAKVVLAGGGILWLGDLPLIAGQLPPAVSPELPFSFRYGGQPSVALLQHWRLERHVERLDNQRTQRTVS